MISHFLPKVKGVTVDFERSLVARSGLNFRLRVSPSVLKGHLFLVSGLDF